MSDTTILEGRDLNFDPALRPALYDGVRTRRSFAFLIDSAFIFVLMVIAFVVIGILGIFTFGLGWLLFPAIWPVVAIVYNAFTLGGPRSATPGMRMMGIEMRLAEGAHMNPAIAVIHALIFWFSVGFLTPLILLVALFTRRKQLLQDLALGTFVIRTPY